MAAYELGLHVSKRRPIISELGFENKVQIPFCK